MSAPKPIVAGALEAYADASWTLGKPEQAALNQKAGSDVSAGFPKHLG